VDLIFRVAEAAAEAKVVEIRPPLLDADVQGIVVGRPLAAPSGVVGLKSILRISRTVIMISKGSF
jgi:hypothetical protein